MDLAGYQILGRVATGSTATVLQARHVALGRMTAIKMIEQVAAGDEALDRLRSEAQTLAALDHPNIVQVYSLTVEDGRAWIAEEWVDGCSLHRMLNQHGPLSAEQALGVMRGALQGLAYAHDRGIVHGDISSTNILVDRDGVAKLIDFELTTGASGPRATPAFASPEVAAGAEADQRSDVFSCAAVLRLLLTGRAAGAGSAIGVGTNDQPHARLGLDGRLADVLDRAQASDPQRRHPDAAHLLDDLEDAVERALGAGWLGRASVAGLTVAAPLVTVAAATASDAAVNEPALPTTVATPVGKASVRTSRTPIAVAAGAIVVVAAAAAFAGTRGSGTPAGSGAASAAPVTTAPASTSGPAVPGGGSPSSTPAAPGSTLTLTAASGAKVAVNAINGTCEAGQEPNGTPQYSLMLQAATYPSLDGDITFSSSGEGEYIVLRSTSGQQISRPGSDVTFSEGGTSVTVDASFPDGTTLQGTASCP